MTTPSDHSAGEGVGDPIPTEIERLGDTHD